MRYLHLTLLPLLVVACADQHPAAPDSSPLFSATAGTNKTPISGTVEFVASGDPARTVTTPSDMCHLWNAPVITYTSGSLEGLTTFDENIHRRCDYSHLVASGPFEGEMTWYGPSGPISGTISGQFTTNCKPDPSQLLGISCDGTYSARGSGDLEGIQFHVKWGPGWYPFTYSGTAFYK